VQHFYGQPRAALSLATPLLPGTVLSLLYDVGYVTVN